MNFFQILHNKTAKLSFGRKALLLIIVIGFCLGFYASCIEPFRLKVTEWTVATSKWTNEKELKIAVLSDAHIIWPWMTPAHLQKIVEKANALKPDIVVLLGDYVATHPFGVQVRPETGVAVFENLSAPCGVYAVLGNHDLNNGPEGWPEALRATKLTVLENRAVPVDCHGQKFWVGGLAEYWKQNADIETTLAQVRDNSPVILLSHNPDPFAKMPQRSALMLAGHTHGGQIRLPFVGAVEAVIPSEYGLRFVYGHIHEDGKDLVVSSGLGMTGLPLRFLMPPEIALVTLKRD